MSVPAVEIFDIPLNRFTERSLNLELSKILDGAGQYLVATPNPEMLLAAREDDNVARVLRRMHVRIPDGFGITLLAKMTGKGNLRRFPGVDVFIDICKLAASRSQRVMIVGGWGKDAKQAALVLETAFPGLSVHHAGDVKINWDGDEWEQPEDIVESINSVRPDIVAVALGSEQYQKQERWIVDHVPQMPSVKLAIGVGGAVDMISGKTQRAPLVFQKTGFEWLWRLLRQPTRYRRIYNALVRFPLAFVSDTIRAKYSKKPYA